MAFAIPLLTAVSAAVGIATGIKSLTTKPPSSTQSVISQQAPEPPKAEDATVQAAEELKKKRRVSMLAGGITDLTRGKALVGAENVGTKTLLGQ